MPKVNEKRTNFIILGDLNIDLIGEANSAIIQFNLLLKKHQLCNIIKQPTQITETSATLIDHFILPKQHQQKIKNVNAIDPALSDHHIIYCSFDILIPNVKKLISNQERITLFYMELEKTKMKLKTSYEKQTILKLKNC